MRLLIVLAAILPAPCLSFAVLAQQTTSLEIAFPVSIQWPRQKDVSRYRLQIAADEKFHNVFFDRRVVGDRYTVSELSPGYYYWRVAPADSQLGEFSRPMRFFISGGTVVPVKLPTHSSRATRSHSSPGVIARKVKSQASLER
ncbi:MAG: hypothetical protein ABJA18_11765 [bacterium]